MPEKPPPGSLERHLEWLYGKGGAYGGDGSPCKCEHAWTPSGMEGGINMGYGWHRTTTHPTCPHHSLSKKERATLNDGQVMDPTGQPT